MLTWIDRWVFRKVTCVSWSYVISSNFQSTAALATNKEDGKKNEGNRNK